VVYLATNPDSSPARVGVVVSSSVGGSVVRHRAARRIRAAAAESLGRLPLGSRLVIRALPGADREPGLNRQVTDGITAVLGAR
jgi:ribonuclease P protein component